ncbi:MAG: hypothetical protein AAB569_03750 [Patescibacteria group bacterium]
MSEVLMGGGGWALSYAVRRMVAKKLFTESSNSIAKNPGPSNLQFARKLLAREATQDLIKDTIPKALGVLGIAIGLYEVIIGNSEFGMASLAFGIPHIIEGLIYTKNRKKNIDKDTGQ